MPQRNVLGHSGTSRMTENRGSDSTVRQFPRTLQLSHLNLCARVHQFALTTAEGPREAGIVRVGCAGIVRVGCAGIAQPSLAAMLPSVSILHRCVGYPALANWSFLVYHYPAPLTLGSARIILVSARYFLACAHLTLDTAYHILGFASETLASV